MKHVTKVVGLVGTLSLAVTVLGQDAGGQGAQSEACRAYAGVAASGMTGGGAMSGGMSGGEGLAERQISEASELQNAAQATGLDESGGATSGGTMSGGASAPGGRLSSAVQRAVGCLGELRADIASGQNAEEAAPALFNIRQDLDRTFRAARVVEESSEALVRLEALELQVSERREDALATLDQVTESLSALTAGGQ